MTDQPSLFNEEQKRTAQGHKFVQTAPADPTPTPEEVRNAALAKLKADGKADSLRARYARLLYKAAQGGVIFETGSDQNPGPDRRPKALTDKEAAFLLGCQVSTICGRRGELSGKDSSLPEYVNVPIVEAHEKRRSIVHDAGVDVTAFRIMPDLFNQLKNSG